MLKMSSKFVYRVVFFGDSLSKKKNHRSSTISEASPVSKIQSISLPRARAHTHNHNHTHAIRWLHGETFYKCTRSLRG